MSDDIRELVSERRILMRTAKELISRHRAQVGAQIAENAELCARSQLAIGQSRAALAKRRDAK